MVTQSSPHRAFSYLLLCSVVLTAMVIASPGCSGKKKGGNRQSLYERSKITYPVETEVVAEKPVVYTVAAVGSVEAFEKVQVTSRVSGVVDRVLFAEGNEARVKKVLVEIETERYTLALEAAQAAYEKAMASLADAEAGLKRRETVILETPGLIPGEEVETWRTKVLTARAELSQAKAALGQAKLNLDDAYVKAPFSGIIQTRTVETGQYVETGTVLATLIRRDPLLLRFKVPESDATRLVVGMTADFRIGTSLSVYKARIVHIAESSEEGSRMVPITAEVSDTRDNALRPGTFAEISVPVAGTVHNPVVVQTAIRPSEKGFLAYVVENGLAVERTVQLGLRTSDGQVEITSGLKAGETLVIRGSEALRDGYPVRAVTPAERSARSEQPAAAGAASPVKKGA